MDTSVINLVLRANDSDDGGDEEHCMKYGASLYTQIMGTIIFVAVWPFIVLDMKWFPLGRPAAALVGAVFMVLFNVVSQEDVYAIEGELGNLQAIFLLVGMMILSYYFDREGLLRILALVIFGDKKPFWSILWKVCLLSAGLAAFITNDATCLVLTPLLLAEFQRQGRNRKELLPLTLGIATSANIGSAATVFGNPQNAFIASAAGVALIDFFIAELPAAIFGTIISVSLLYLFFIKLVLGKDTSQNEEEESTHDADPDPYKGLAAERGSIALSHDQSERPGLSSQLAKERELMFSTEHISQSSSIQQMPKSRSRHSMPDPKDPTGAHPIRSVSNPDIKRNNNIQDIQLEVIGGNGGVKQESPGRNKPEEEEVDEVINVRWLKERTIREKVFIGWLVFVSVLLVVLLAIPPPPTVNAEFNLGCIPLGSAILTMLVDTIVNKRYAFDAMLKIDWTVILMFMGLFIWLGGFQETCFPYMVFNALRPYMNLYRFEGVILFTVFVILGSNIFSNVPLVILIVDRIDELCGEDTVCEGPLGGLLLAWIATVAGNFTLIGSVANLIVAEKARSSANYRLTFLRYLRFGFVSTIIVIFSALPIVYFLGRLA